MAAEVPAEVVDLCGSDTEEDEPQPKRVRTEGYTSASASTISAAASSSSSSGGGAHGSSSSSGKAFGYVQRLDLPGGVLDEQILSRVAAIAQQSNCVGVDGRGLAAGIAQKLSYGCSYKDRRPMGGRSISKFAVVQDRATPGTLDVRRPPAAVFGASARPIVVNMFSQYEMGPPGKYRRVTPMPDDSAAERLAWFGECLGRIAALRLPSIAFPHEIGCGLAGGDWSTYNRLLVSFAEANPGVEVFICRWVDATPRPTGARGGGGGAGACFKCGQRGHWANRCPV